MKVHNSPLSEDPDGTVLYPVVETTPGATIIGGGGGGLTQEDVQDIVGALIQAGGNVNVVYNDGAGTLTISVTGLTSAAISDFAEAVDDRAGALFAAGSGITLAYNDAGNTFSISVTGGTFDAAGAATAAQAAATAAAAVYTDAQMARQPVASNLVVNGGVYIPPRSLDRWSVGLQNTLTNIVFVGDSVFQGTAINGINVVGYLDNAVMRVGRAIGSAFGGLKGAGFFGLWRSGNALGVLNTAQEWAFAGTLPTLYTITADGSYAPYGRTYSFAAAATNIATLTPSAAVAARYVSDCVTNGTTTITSATASFVAANDIGQTVYGDRIPRNAHIKSVTNGTTAVLNLSATGSGSGGVLGLQGRLNIFGGIAQVDLYDIDNPVQGTYSYSVNNGGAWTNIVSVHPAISLRKTSIVTTLPNGNFKVRAANAAGTGAAFNLVGVSILNAAAPTSGVVVHNIAMDGEYWNNNSNTGLIGPAGGSGDWFRLLDNNGQSINASIQPSLIVTCFSNDCVQYHAGTLTLAQHKANVQAFITRFFGYCDIIVVNPPEQDRSSFGITTVEQADLRQATKEVCALNGVALLDIYDAWSAQGETGYTAANAAGLMLDTVHPSLEGHADIAGHILRILSGFGI